MTTTEPFDQDKEPAEAEELGDEGAGPTEEDLAKEEEYRDADSEGGEAS